MLVHAPCEPGERIDEEWPLEPKWAHPQSKLETEERIRKCERAKRGEHAPHAESAPSPHPLMEPAAPPAHGEHSAMPNAHADHVEMVREMREPWLWTNSLLIALGVWLMFAPSVF